VAAIRRLLAAAAAGVLLAASPVMGAEAAPSGKGDSVVASVRFQVSSPYLISYAELAALVTIRPGDALTEEAVRNSIRGLHAKAIFREVIAYAREEGGKADLLFYLRPSPLISEIEVAGAKKVPSAQILSAARIRRGSPITERDFREAAEAVKKLLARKGFTAAAVTLSATCNLESGAGKVRTYSPSSFVPRSVNRRGRLLVEERHARGVAPCAYRARPGKIMRPEMRARLAAVGHLEATPGEVVRVVGPRDCGLFSHVVRSE